MLEFEFEGSISYSGAYTGFFKFMCDVVLPTLDPESHDLQEIKVRIYKHNLMAVYDVFRHEQVFDPFKVVTYSSEGFRDVGPGSSYVSVVAVIATPYSLAGLM